MLEKLLLQILNMSFTASFVVAFILLARLPLKKAPKKFSYTLWSVVLFRLICPFSFESVLSLLPTKANPISQDIVYMQTPQIDTGITILNNAVNTILPAATPQSSVNPLQIWVFICSLLWLFGIAILLLYSLATLFRLQKQLKDATLYRDNIFISPKIDTAFVLGVFHPKIYLPANLSHTERNYILLHEKTHIKRLDHIVKIISFFALCVHWFNPFVWIAFFLSGKDMEMSCDEAVIKQLGNGVKKDYSSSLLTLATGRRIIGGTPLAFGEGNTKGRIKNVLNYKKPTFWIIVAAMVACIVVAVCFLTNPKDDALHTLKPFGHSYSVTEIFYDAPQYSFTYTLDNAPKYCLTSDYALLVKDDILNERSCADRLTLGSMTETELTKDNFDRYIEINGGGGWREDITAGKLRNDNKKAWRLLVANDSNSVFYYLLQQKNGDVYLTYGYYDPDSETNPASDDSSIRWLFKLTMDNESEGKIDQRPTIIMDGQVYINPYMPVDTLPDGYAYAGELLEEMANDTDLSGCGYYASSESSDDFYVYQECRTPISADTVDPEKRQWAYVQWIAKDTSAAGDSNTSKQVIVSEPVQEQTALDLAVSAAILEHNRDGHGDSDFACESHMTLATLPKERWDEDSDSAIQTVEVYLMVLYQKYRYSGSGFSNTRGSHIPCVLTFDDTAAGYTLTNYWEPRDGSYYKPDIEKRFDELDSTTVAEALDTQKFILAQIQNCYAQAVEYGKVDTNAVIAGLLETICSSPAEASTPSAYIDAHTLEYRELTYYGDYTLRYVFLEFLKGGQTDLKGHIMRIVMDDLIGDEAIKISSATGQAYFDAWLEHVRQIEAANDTDYMKEYTPKSWLLRQMIEE